MSPSKVEYSCLECGMKFDWYPKARDHSESTSHPVYDSLRCTPEQIRNFIRMYEEISKPSQEQPRHAFD